MVAEALKLEGFVRTLESWGLTDVMLPFLLIFVIVYAILQKTKIELRFYRLLLRIFLLWFGDFQILQITLEFGF